MIKLFWETKITTPYIYNANLVIYPNYNFILKIIILCSIILSFFLIFLRERYLLNLNTLRIKLVIKAQIFFFKFNSFK